MNSFWNNSQAVLHGPYLVFLLTAIGIAGLIVGGAWIWLCDPTRDHDLPDASPEVLDPYEMAWLRSGPVGVMRVTVADLMQQGLLERHRPPKWLGLISRRLRLRQCPKAAGSSSLMSLQRTAWTWFGTPRLSRDIIHPKSGLVPVVAPLCASFAKGLEERQMLETTAHKVVRRVVAWTMSLGILGIGLYLLVASALAEQRADLPLIAMIVGGLVSTAIVCRETRLSNLGQRFLEQVRLEFDARLADALASEKRYHLSESSRLLGVALLDDSRSRNFKMHDIEAAREREFDSVEDDHNSNLDDLGVSTLIDDPSPTVTNETHSTPPTLSRV